MEGSGSQFQEFGIRTTTTTNTKTTTKMTTAITTTKKLELTCWTESNMTFRRRLKNPKMMESFKDCLRLWQRNGFSRVCC